VAATTPLPRLLVLATMLSGAAALVDEMVWVRLLGQVFGHTAYAVQVVLAVFFAGVAAGSAASDRWLLSPRRLLIAYAAVELGVGLAALLFPWMVGRAIPLYDRVAPLALETGPAHLCRLATGALLLAVPTALMGASLPLLLRWAAAAGADGATGSLYAANTLGGAAGAWTSAFVLVPGLGVAGALRAAAAASAVAAAIAVGLARPTRVWTTDRPGRAAARGRAVSPLPAGAAPLLLFLGGLEAIALEVVWTRALDQRLSGTVYAFATVLSVFLVGLAGGSAAYRALRPKLDPLPLLISVETILCVAVVASLYAIRLVPRLAGPDAAALGSGFVRQAVAVESLASGAVLLLPCTGLGFVFPLLVDLGRAQGPRVGSLLAVNSLGCVAGPLAAGLFLLPRLGLRDSLLLLAALLASISVALWILTRREGAPRWTPAGVSLAFVLALAAPREIRYWGPPPERLVDYREDPAATVSVVTAGSGPPLLKVNDRILGGGFSVFSEHRQGHLPMLLHPDPRRVLLLGVGTGNTAGAILLHRPDRLVGAELVQGALDLARIHFAATNYGVLASPRAEILCADAWRLVRATPERYDVVVGDLFHPWEAGVGALYTREHFARVRRALLPGGTFCQWLPLFQLSTDDLRMVIRTFLSAFPSAQAWLGNLGTDVPIVGLVGSEREATLWWRGWEAARGEPSLRRSLDDARLDAPAELLAGYVGGTRALRDFAGDGPLNTEDSARLEFRAPRTFFARAFGFDGEERLLALPAGPAPVDFTGALDPPDAPTLAADVAAARRMLAALLLHERTQTRLAVETAIEAARLSRTYRRPADVLRELAWSSLHREPDLAAQAFDALLLLVPVDPDAREGLSRARKLAAGSAAR